jgi:hypothetical protein
MIDAVMIDAVMIDAVMIDAVMIDAVMIDAVMIDAATIDKAGMQECPPAGADAWASRSVAVSATVCGVGEFAARPLRL